MDPLGWTTTTSDFKGSRNRSSVDTKTQPGCSEFLISINCISTIKHLLHKPY